MSVLHVLTSKRSSSVRYIQRYTSRINCVTDVHTTLKELAVGYFLPCIKNCVTNTSVVPYKFHGRILTKKQRHSHELRMFQIPALRDM